MEVNKPGGPVAPTAPVHFFQSLTTSTVDVTSNSTVMLSFLNWVIPQYIVLAPTSIS